MDPVVLCVDEPPPVHSVRLLAPGRPLPMGRRRLVRDTVWSAVRRSAALRGFAVLPAAAPAGCEEVELAGTPADLRELGDLQTFLLRAAAAKLHADLIGGANVTRLDRMIRSAAPCLDYDEARQIANARGHSLADGAELDEAAGATLVRYCGNLPVQVFGLPRAGVRDEARPSTATGRSERFRCYVPLAGEAASGHIGRGGRARLRLGLTRLLQYMMGLERPGDALVSTGASGD